MRKLILIILIFQLYSCNKVKRSEAGTVYISKDFEDSDINSGGWSTQVVVDTTNWRVVEFNSGNKCAYINNWNSVNSVSQSWLISPNIDLSKSVEPYLNFDNVNRWEGDMLRLLISTNYDGQGNPNDFIWGDFTSYANWDLISSTYESWTFSENVDLSIFSNSSIYIAFKYVGSSFDGKAWAVDNIIVKEPEVFSN